MPATALTYRADVDGLRAIAVIAVVLFHAFPTLLPGGFVGVDVFFVISGYLIGSILIREIREHDYSVARFYARRVKRIFPALIVVLVAVYAFAWFNLLDDEFMALGKQIVAGAGFVSNLALWHESGYFDAAAETKPLLHLWSLGVEEQFYLVWPLLLYAVGRLRGNLLTATVVIGLASFALNLYTASHDPTADFYSPLTRFWELMAGCLLASRHMARGTITRCAEAKSWFGVALILGAVFLLRGQSGFPGWQALLPTLGAYLIIDANTAASFNARVLASRPMVGVGLISFPLYLWHWPLLSYARIIEGGTPDWFVRTLVIVVAFVLAWMTWRFVERPVRSRATARGERSKIAALSVLMIAIGLQGYNTYRRQGMSFRLATSVTQFANVEHDVGHAWREHQCFLGGEDSPESFTSACTDAGTGPIVFLWGDSRAAAFYPGLRAFQQKESQFRLAQYTASACLPALGNDTPNTRCAAVNADAMKFVKQDKPDIVILTADWSVEKLQTVPHTVDAIRKAGGKNVVLLGPLPRWPEFLPKVYWRYWRRYHEVLPKHSRFGLDATTEGIDRTAQAMAAKLGIRYVSAYQAMCTKEGCLTRSGAGKGEITTWDDAHLTPPESVMLVEQLAPTLLEAELGARANLHSGEGRR